MATDLERGEYTTLRWASEFLIQELVELMFIQAATPRRTLKRIYADLPHEDQRFHCRGPPRWMRMGFGSAELARPWCG